MNNSLAIHLGAFSESMKDTLSGTLPDWFISSANGSHAVYRDLNRMTSSLHKRPQNRTSESPPHRGLRPLLFSNSVCSLTFHASDVRRRLRFIVLIQEE